MSKPRDSFPSPGKNATSPPALRHQSGVASPSDNDLTGDELEEYVRRLLREGLGLEEEGRAND